MYLLCGAADFWCSVVPTTMQKAVSLGEDAFNKRDYWHDERSPSSFTRIRCMSSAAYVEPQLFSILRKAASSTGSSANLLEKVSNVRESGGRSEDLSGSEGSLTSSGSATLSVESAEVVRHEGFCVPQTCSACGRMFKATDMVVLFDSEVLHTSCFSCGRCGSRVDPIKRFLILDDGSPLCLNCSPVCHMCGEQITCNHVGVLNKDFHESCLKCCQCHRPFATMTKVYASNGEPCCAECITPVFNETWSPRSSGGGTEALTTRNGTQLSPATNRKRDTTISAGRHTLPPKLENLSQAVSDLPTARKFHSLLRPSFSASSFNCGPTASSQMQKKLSLSSLQAILYDELGVSLFMNYCVEDCSIELVVFWLDVEHFRHFDGDDEDTKLFAHHIMLKYIGYYAELPLGLPKSIEDKIIEDLQNLPCSQDIFNEAQKYVYEHMEKTMLSSFLQSQDGRNYLEALITRDINRRQQKRSTSVQMINPLRATVTNFDKRHLNTKFYVYEIQVDMENSKALIYRRYSEFHALDQELKIAFPVEKFPPMPKKIFFGRSQTRTVAQQRMKELQAYLQGVLSMSPEILRSDVLQQFLTQTLMDIEDEEFNRRIRACQEAV